MDRNVIEHYLRDDAINALRRLQPAAAAHNTKGQAWLDGSAAKRAIFHSLYGDLLGAGARRLRVLDVGGGLSAFTALLAKAHDYTLIDPLDHESGPISRAVLDESPAFVWERGDWRQAAAEGPYDVVIANDLFPNVDQRLSLFMPWALGRGRELRLSLTFYNEPRAYETKRVDADEHLWFLAFDGARTLAALAPFAAAAQAWTPDVFDAKDGSVFPNGRHVVLATFTGDTGS